VIGYGFYYLNDDMIANYWSKLFTTNTIVNDNVELAKAEYLRKHDLKSMLAYGRALDTTMVNMDAERAALESEFYRLLAKDAGDSVGIPWNYLYGIWMRESQMDPTSKGDGRLDAAGHIIPGSFKAFGLGQIHVATARSEVDPKLTKEQLLDPIINGHASAKILKNYTQRFGGNIRYGISAYQQGPGVTQSQYNKRSIPNNIAYVLDVLEYAAKVNGQSK
jgi:hypothetical protein